MPPPAAFPPAAPSAGMPAIPTPVYAPAPEETKPVKLTVSGALTGATASKYQVCVTHDPCADLPRPPDVPGEPVAYFGCTEPSASRTFELAVDVPRHYVLTVCGVAFGAADEVVAWGEWTKDARQLEGDAPVVRDVSVELERRAGAWRLAKLKKLEAKSTPSTSMQAEPGSPNGER